MLWPHARLGRVFSEFDSLPSDQFVVAQQSERQFEKLGVVGATPTGETNTAQYMSKEDTWIVNPVLIQLARRNT